MVQRDSSLLRPIFGPLRHPQRLRLMNRVPPSNWRESALQNSVWTISVSVPGHVVERLKIHSDEKDYLPVQGLPTLRKAICDWHKRTHAFSFTLTKS